MANYLLVPIPKNPYSRIGPKAWQDWVRQARFTATFATQLEASGHTVEIALITRFQPAGKPSEIELYTHELKACAPNLSIVPYNEALETIEQVEKSFTLAGILNGNLIFISAWLQYPRVRYLARGRKAQHYGIFGIPQPAFAIIDPVCMVFQPLTDFLGLTGYINRAILKQRRKGRIL